MGTPTPALSEHTRSDSPDFPWSFSSFLQETSNKERKGMLPSCRCTHSAVQGNRACPRPRPAGSQAAQEGLAQEMRVGNSSIHPPGFGSDLWKAFLKGRPCSQDQTTKEETRMPSSRDGDAHPARSGASLRNPRLEQMLCSSMLPPT